MTRIPAGLSWLRGGNRYSHVTPRGVQLHLRALCHFHELRGASPGAQAPPSLLMGTMAGPPGQAFCLASSDRRATRARLGTTLGCLPHWARLPALLPSPGTAHP